MLHLGVQGINMIRMNKTINFPIARDIKTLKYIRDYVFPCPCHEISCSDLCMTVPGAGFNHSREPNTQICCTDGDGIGTFASRDIFKGEWLHSDYNFHPSPPTWFTGFLEKWLGNPECVMLNDYILK